MGYQNVNQHEKLVFSYLDVATKIDFLFVILR